MTVDDVEVAICDEAAHRQESPDRLELDRKGGVDRRGDNRHAHDEVLVADDVAEHANGQALKLHEMALLAVKTEGKLP